MKELAKRGLLVVALLGTAAGLSSGGTYATWTDSATANETIASGTVDVSLGADGSADNRLTVGASGLVPGDTVQRRVKVSSSSANNGQDLASVTLTTTASTSSVLDTDATSGLQMKIERCTNGTWTEGGTAPATTYTCDLVSGSGVNNGTRASVLAERAVIGSNLSLNGMQAVTAGSTDDLVVTLRLPDSTGTAMQNKSSTLVYTFTGTQRTGTSN